MFSYRAAGAAQRDTRKPPMIPGPLEWASGYGPGADIKLPSVMLHPTMDFDDPSSAASDFVKRLYRLLEERTFDSIIGWGAEGDTFVVKDMNEFTRHVMPKMFKHSNFASFVRQLNKYDFHKVKSSNPDDAKYGEQSWTFKHPHFQSKNLDGLENVKRKIPPKKAPTAATTTTKRSASATPPTVDEALSEKLDAMSRSQDDLRALVERLDNNYQTVLRELVAVQHTVAQQETIMQQLVQQLIVQQSPPEFKPFGAEASFSDNALTQTPFALATPSASSADSSPFNISANNGSAADASPFPPISTSSAGAEVGPYRPKWSIPPRVLVVDDDAVSRTLSSRLLQDSGCTFDIASDGMGAVDKMNLGKYDLVLMDISMPNLDGLSATSIIRQFDVLTPIVSMTGNANPEDVVKYFSHGMNDVLSKPISITSVVAMLEKHLVHLKASWPLPDLSNNVEQQQYLAMIPQQPSTYNTAKRSCENSDNERDAKRGRFDLVE